MRTNPQGTRDDDNRLLEMVRQREAGMTAAEIAAGQGISKQRVQSMTNRVMDADLAESGEDLSGDYWARRVQARKPKARAVVSLMRRAA